MSIVPNNDKTVPKRHVHPNHTALGNSELIVSRIGLGCWPMAGITSVGVSDADSVATIHAAIDHGIHFFDTAYAYGYDGRSDRVLRLAIGDRRNRVIIAHKVGTHWNERRERCVDGSPERLLSQAEECLTRLGTDYVDVMYLHTSDPKISIEESASAIQEICQRGWARYAAVSNVSLEEARRFEAVCPIVAIQPYFNMFQQDAVQGLMPIIEESKCACVCYWVLMKGLLAGKLLRDHVFDPTDRRLTYPIFQGKAWHRAQDLLDQLRSISNDLNCTVSQLVIAWTLAQPGISVALLGAKRPEQIIETAKSMELRLEESVLRQINHFLRLTVKHRINHF